MARELAGGLFWLAISVLAVVQGHALKLGTLNRPGPGFFPFWSGVVLGILSLVLLVRSLGPGGRLSFSGIRWPKLLLVVGALLCYLVFLEPIGFIAMTFLFLLLLFGLEGMGWIRSAIWSAVASGLAYALFRLWLGTQLPRGLLGF